MFKVILAIDQLGGIGNNGTLPWPHNSEDMAWFQRKTKNQIVVMGRKTWDDKKMPKPLPNRVNIVVTQKPIHIAGITAIHGDIISRLNKIQDAYPDKDIFVIGGKQLVESCLPFVDTIYLTHFTGAYKVDTSIHIDSLLQDFTIRTATPGKTCMFAKYVRNKIKTNRK